MHTYGQTYFTFVTHRIKSVSPQTKEHACWSCSKGSTLLGGLQSEIFVSAHHAGYLTRLWSNLAFFLDFTLARFFCFLFPNTACFSPFFMKGFIVLQSVLCRARVSSHLRRTSPSLSRRCKSTSLQPSVSPP
jgi:hypothetical protein